MKLLLIATIALVCCLYAAQADQFGMKPGSPKALGHYDADQGGAPPKNLVEEASKARWS
uniref:Uncharacterized protein n=1 Tax=Rhodnius prolixus TaxID=13249 RepID=T1HII6_RHOPR